MKNILILRRGLLGDSLVAIPALRLIKSTFPDSHICYVSDHHPERSFVSPKNVFCNLNLVDSFLSWSVSRSIVFRIISLLSLIRTLRKVDWEMAILLERNNRGTMYIKSQIFFLYLCGVRNVVTDNLEVGALRGKEGKLLYLDHETDYLLNLLYKNNIRRNNSFNPCQEIQILPNKTSDKKVNSWIKSHNLSDKKLVAIAVNTNMPVKKWPIERYIECINILTKTYGITPLFIGGSAEMEKTKPLVKLTNGVMAMGVFSIFETVTLLRKCEFYLGNDTGSHHLAAAAGIPCVVIFSSRDNPGKWYPYGKNHEILRVSVDCEGCMLYECSKSPTCVQQITVNMAVDSCKKIINLKV
jgi:heptosyltransferase III